MDKLKYIKFEESQGQYTNSIPIGVDSKNVDLKTGYNLEETLGDYDLSQGTIEERFDSINKIYNTFLDLASDKTIQNNSLVQTLGYYDINDNGKGLYLITKNPKTYYQKISNNLFAQLIFPENTINIKIFGIKNDGSNQSERIQAALDYSINKKLLIDDDTSIAFEENIIVPSYTHLILNGKLNIIGTKYGSIQNMDGKEHSAYSGNGNIIIEGNGGIQANSSNAHVPLRFAHCENITLKNIYVKNWSYYHAIEIMGVKNCLIDNVKFLGMASPETYYTPAIQVEPVTDSTHSGGALPYDGTQCKNIKIKNCYFGPNPDNDNICYSGIQIFGTQEEDLENVIIENNTFDNLNCYAIMPRFCKKIIINNNICNNVGFAFISDSSTSSKSCEEGVITNNIINTSGYLTSYNNAHCGISLYYAKNVIISNNILNDIYGQVIALPNCNNVTLTNNRIQDGVMYNQINNLNHARMLYLGHTVNLLMANNIFNLNEDDSITTQLITGTPQNLSGFINQTNIQNNRTSIMNTINNFLENL